MPWARELLLRRDGQPDSHLAVQGVGRARERILDPEDVPAVHARRGALGYASRCGTRGRAVVLLLVGCGV